jgi:transposase InsO family protein
VRFIDEHRHDMVDGRQFGVEPICRVLSEHGCPALFKTELIFRRGPWRSLDAIELATLEWVDWYNNRRLFEAIGDIPPAEAEANHYRTTAPSENLQMVEASLR